MGGNQTHVTHLVIQMCRFPHDVFLHRKSIGYSGSNVPTWYMFAETGFSIAVTMSLYYYAAVELAHADDVARVAQARMCNKRTRDDHNSFNLSDRAFIAKYRLSKPLVRSLVEELRPRIALTLRSDAFNVETKKYWTFVFRGRKKKLTALTILLIFLLFAMCYVSLVLLKVIEKKGNLSRRASYGPDSYVDESGIRVIVGYYDGKANGKVNLTEEEINKNNYSPVRGEGEMGRPVMMQQRDLIRAKELHSLHRFNILASDRISINRTLRDIRSKSCAEIKYDLDNLPSASVIIIFHNEAWSTLMRTITSVLTRSPDALLKEIIIVDDASTRKYLGAELETDIAKLAKVRLLRQPDRKGLVGARLRGARSASGDVLLFLDAHCEVTPGWLEPLLERAGSDDVFVCPHIDIISSETFSYTQSTDAHWGAFNWHMRFRWIIPSKNILDKMDQDPTKAYPTPTMAGGLFAVRKSLFWRLGGYDEGFKIWGGENLEMSWRAWQCGARVEIAPCSRVGHVFRKTSPYTFPVKLIRNLTRAVLVWLDEWAEFFFKFHPDAAEIRDQVDVASMMELRKNLNCKSFKWYLENVWPTHYFPTDDRWLGRIRNDKNGCLTAKQNSHPGLGGPAFGIPCGSDNNLDRLLLYTPEGLIVAFEDLCLEERNKTAVWKPCVEGNSRQIWYQRGPRLKNSNGLCLTLVRKAGEPDEEPIVIQRCRKQDSAQIWHFERVPWRTFKTDLDGCRESVLQIVEQGEY